MKKYYVVLNEEKEALVFDSSPWGDGESLLIRDAQFAVFTSKKKANQALTTTKKYAISQDLNEFWHTEGWEVVSLESYLEKVENE